MIKFGFNLIKGKANHSMEDYHVVKFMQIQQHELVFLLSTMVIWEIL
ncbi:hypothetical protein Gorai_013183 [Gossypium raimondii]|uniref:Uncharacterized protein n=1 Tax=Gossypium raimondii TaxID=29730 RepID=A0A7J8Q491_GOSRA|nr:hypothetical protein [Gossypium raimondii]